MIMDSLPQWPDEQFAGMVSPAAPNTPDHSLKDTETDYGSDLDISVDEEVQLLAGQPLLPSEDNPIVCKLENHGVSQTLRLPRVIGLEERSPLFKAARDAQRVAEEICDSFALHEHAPSLSKPLHEAGQARQKPSSKGTLSPTANPVVEDEAPIKRLRSYPKKSLSVTDLISPAWCELQYWYSLTIHGKKKRTLAMDQGVKVHKVLEAQVHTIVRVEVQTKEDGWGLRIWNTIQGLRTLRSTGLTRELEVWGTIDGVVVNGMIDELTYICPDAVLEHPNEIGKRPQSLPKERTIEKFFKKDPDSLLPTGTEGNSSTSRSKIYICDVKTRAARSLPSETAFRPTKYQLMLYHHLVSSLIKDEVSFSTIATRFKLDAEKVFSDAFIAKVGSLNQEIYHDALSSSTDTSPETSENPQFSRDSMDVLTAHNTLSSLWGLMIQEFRTTFPHGAESLGDILKTEYRSADQGEIRGVKTLAMDQEALVTYLKHEIRWWKGERPPEGVVVDEAYKCRSCDFAEMCEWRVKKVEEVIEKARLGRARRAV